LSLSCVVAALLFASMSKESPAIYRCSGCGALVHPSDPERPVAWCPRCRRVVEAVLDGGAA